MKFDKFTPSPSLAPYVRHFIISENDMESTYKVLPQGSMVIGFQYSGHLSALNNNLPTPLNISGITGITDSFRIFKNSNNTGTVLVYFSETGFTHFTSCPANELFNQSISLEDIFDKNTVKQTEEKLSGAINDKQRIRIVEQFLRSQLRQTEEDKLIVEAVKMIYNSKGSVSIRELHKALYISQSPFEKRFRKIVGTSPKKFASIVRFNTVLNDMNHIKSLVDICYENNFFDQAHFIKDFKKFTGDTPEQFKRLL